jgi:hypothetical protein
VILLSKVKENETPKIEEMTIDEKVERLMTLVVSNVIPVVNKHKVIIDTLNEHLGIQKDKIKFLEEKMDLREEKLNFFKDKIKFLEEKGV